MNQKSDRKYRISYFPVRGSSSAMHLFASLTDSINLGRAEPILLLLVDSGVSYHHEVISTEVGSLSARTILQRRDESFRFHFRLSRAVEHAVLAVLIGMEATEAIWSSETSFVSI